MATSPFFQGSAGSRGPVVTSERADQASRSGFAVLDGAALVAGAAVASVHLRGVLGGDRVGPGWVLGLAAFVWIALTSAGPFVFLVRRDLRGLARSPKVGERLWALLGLPWLATAMLQAVPPSGPAASATLATALSLGLAAASLIALIVVWTTWVVVSPDHASKAFSPPWTNRIGLLLAIAWPVQCAAGMFVIG